MNATLRALAVLLVALPASAQEATKPDPSPQAPRTKLAQRLHSMAERAPIVVAHRGDSGAFPENSLPSFEAAMRAKAGMIEFDVRQTADGVLVCIHDGTLDRTTNGAEILGRRKQRVESLRAADLEKVDAGSWKGARFAGTKIPTLADALTVIQRGAVAMIEHKAGDPAKYVEVLRKEGLVDSVLLQSFDWDFLRAVHALEPRLTLGVLGPRDDAKQLTPAVMASAAALGASMIHWRAQDLRVETIAELHARGYLVCSYTTDDDMALVGGAAIGLDAITTNLPGRLAKLIADGVAVRRR